MILLTDQMIVKKGLIYNISNKGDIGYVIQLCKPLLDW